MFDQTNRVSIIRDDPHSGDVACADCDRPSTIRVLIDGVPWCTACRRHAPGLVNAAFVTVHAPTVPRRRVFAFIDHYIHTARLDSGARVP